METKSSAARRNLQAILVLVVVFAAGMFFGTQGSTLLAQGNRTELPTEAQTAFEPLFEVYNLIQRDFIEDVPIEALVDGAIGGMMDVLDDQYSNYIDPESFAFTESTLSGEFEGIGAVIGYVEDTEEIRIVDVLDGSPAQASGLKIGDIFVLVNGESVEGLTTTELAARVRGEAGTTVDLTMRREGQLLEFTVERARLELPNVVGEVLDDDIGYISLANFSRGARDQINDALTALQPENLNGLIFDLRDNPGGFLDTATEVAGLFQEDGVILIEEFGDGTEITFELDNGTVVQRFDNGTERVYSQNAAFSGLTVPVVVLVNERSASASELVAGAWQDNGTVTVIGETTFGKGTVQIQNQLVNGGGVRLTTARWLTPLGNSINEQGITPDIIVEIADDAELPEDDDPQLDAAIEFLLTGEVTVETEPEPSLGVPLDSIE